MAADNVLNERVYLLSRSAAVKQKMTVWAMTLVSMTRATVL